MNAVLILLMLLVLLALGFWIAAGSVTGAAVLPLAIFAALFGGLAAGICIGLWLRPEYDGKDDVR